MISQKPAITRVVGDLTGWNLTSDKNGMQIYTRENENGGLKIVRAEGHFDFPASVVADYAADPQIRCEVDKVFVDAKVIEEIGAGLAYEYVRMKGALIFSDRDFCTIRHRKEEESGRIIISAYSAEHPECPEVSGAVRGTLNIFGYVMTPNPEDADKCFVQLILHGDMKGHLPSMFANQAVIANGKFLHKLNKRLKSEA